MLIGASVESKTNYINSKVTKLDAVKAQPYLGYRPLKVIRRTLEVTTQLARLVMDGPMRRHRQALYPFLNRRRIHETVATDTFFSNVKMSQEQLAHKFYTV